MSELHNRLAHLVNYSSQLIFVSGDSVADQQRTLNEFLAHQQDDTEISYFSASPEQAEKDYRGMICRQLGGHTVSSFVRPLNQLLIDLPADDGPFLVCITQAENLNNDFLQELWDWVMHAKQYNRKLHLNIILFGKDEWAQSSQNWLPSQNSNKPVLLSSESVDAVGFDVNALEALMAQDNNWITRSSSPLVTKKWFIGTVLGVFLCVFIGMISWQYPDDIRRLLAGEPPSHAELPAFDINEEDLAEAIINPQEEAAINKQYQAQIEVVSAPTLTDELLVRSWKKSPDNAPIQQADTVLPNNELQQSLAANTDSDFQVPDIISVAQLDETLDIDEELISENLVSNPNETAINEQTNTTDAKTVEYRFDESTLLALPTDSIVLQLSGIQNPTVLENYLNRNNLKASTWVYQTQRYGGPWYVVVYKQAFESIDAALGSLSNLPDDVQDAQPFAKSINQIQKEIMQR